MCGRFAFYSPAEATAALFGAAGSPDVGPRFNIAPTQDIAAVRDSEEKAGGREVVALRWGLVPFWAKDPAIGNRMINARAETVAEKPAFRAAYRRRRCLVLADGFYEWHREGSVKTPWYISLASEGPFAFAGLWEHWRSKETDGNAHHHAGERVSRAAASSHAGNTRCGSCGTLARRRRRTRYVGRTGLSAAEGMARGPARQQRAQ